MDGAVLWLDNDPVQILAYVDALKEEGLEVILASTLTEAARVLGEQTVDLFIVDCMVPTKTAAEEERYPPAQTDMGYRSGVVFLEKNKALIDGVSRGVVVMTARLDPVIRDEVLKAGVPGGRFFTKFDLRDIDSFLQVMKAVMEPNG